MKKVFVLFAVAAMIVACNKPAQKEETSVDSIVTETVEVVVDADSIGTDSIAQVATDSVK